MSIKWTKERITLEAKKYNSHTDFWKGAAQAVKVAKRDNFYDEITKHFKRKLVKHTKQSCLEAALLCETKEEFKRIYRNQHASALHNGWYEECTAHMPLNSQFKFKNNKSNCLNAALKCNTMSQFIKEFPGAYNQARKGGFINEISAHFEVKGNILLRLLYIVKFSDDSIYIGLTSDFKRRVQQHLDLTSNKKSTVLKHYEKTKNAPKFYQISNLMPASDAKIIEQKLIRIFSRVESLTLLNKNSGGGLGGARIRRKISFDEIKSKILNEKINTQRELKRLYRTLYTVAKNRNWLNLLIPKKTASINSKEQCFEKALACNSKQEFYANCRPAYNWAKQNKCFEEVTAHMVNPNKKWTFETVLNTAVTYPNFSEFAKNNQRAVYVARRDGYLDEIKLALVKIK